MKNKVWIVVLIIFTIISLAPVSSENKIITFSYEIDNVDYNYSTASGSALNSTEAPWSDFLAIDVTVGAAGRNVQFDYVSQNIDDKEHTQASGATIMGDDVILTSTNGSWIGKWIVGDGLIQVSSNFDINPEYTNNSERYGIWLDATGDGDVSDGDDYPVYNDLYIVDKTGPDIILKPAMMVRDLDKLKGSAIEVRGEKFLVRDKSEYSLEIVKVSEVGIAVACDDCMEPAVIFPDQDYKIILQNLTNGTGGLGNSINPSADFKIIEGGVVTAVLIRNNATDPPLVTGVDLELLSDYYVYATEINVPKRYIKFVIGKKSDEFTVNNGDTNILGYSKAVVNPGGPGDWFNEFRLEDEEIVISKGGEAQLGNTNTYIKYTEDKEFYIVAKKTKAAASGAKLNASKSPWSEFLKRDVTVSISDKTGVVVLANSIDWRLASDLVKALETSDLFPIHVQASEFEDYKDSSSILILGGPDAYDGVGVIVQDLLTEVEQGSVRENGNGDVYFRANEWAKDQKIVIVAGSDRNKTKDMHDKHRKEIVFSKLARLKDIQCDNISNELLDKMKDSVWIDTGRSCIMCLACGCSCTTEDKWISEEFSISVTSVSCGRDSYTLRFKNETGSCSTKEASKTPFVDFNELT